MQSRFKFSSTLMLLVLLLASPLAFSEVKLKPLELSWLDLIPEEERDQFTSTNQTAINHSGSTPEQPNLGTVRQELDGKVVKIPGFIVSLAGDREKVTEFLLVPYFGACIHVPPPPPNQIIYVKFEKGIPVHHLWEASYIIGKLKTTSATTELADTGYLIEGVSVESFEPK